MDEDDFLVEAAGWARYYEKAYEVIQQISTAHIAEAPPQEIIDDPQAFYGWVEQCKRINEVRNRY